MAKHPKVIVPASRLEILFNILSVLLLVMMTIYAVNAYAQLPHTIPTHFNIQGEADGWGRKASILILPLVSFIIFVPMYFVSRIPHHFNYTVELTKENAPRIYPIARLMMATLNFIIVAMFAFFVWETVEAVHGQSVLGPWFAFVALFLPLVLMIFFVIWMHRVE